MKTIEFTGLTMDEFGEDIRATERGEDRPRLCYICKRPQGACTLSIGTSGECKILLDPDSIHDPDFKEFLN